MWPIVWSSVRICGRIFFLLHGYWWQNVLICRQHRRLGTDIFCLWANLLVSKAERFERIDSTCPNFNPGVFQPSKLKHVLVSVSEKLDFQKLDLSRTQKWKFLRTCECIGNELVVLYGLTSNISVKKIFKNVIYTLGIPFVHFKWPMWKNDRYIKPLAI